MHTVKRHGSLTAGELAAALHDYVVVDIRDSADWAAGHIPGALHLPTDRLAGPWPDPDPRLPVAVFAAEQDDADAAIEVLHAAGRDAVVVGGGIDAWRAARQPLVTNKQ